MKMMRPWRTLRAQIKYGGNIMKDLIIIGASGFGRGVYDMILRINEKEKTFNVLGFIDDNEALWGNKLNGLEVLGGIEYAKEHFDKNVAGTIAIASAGIKRKIVEELNDLIEWVNIIDPTALVSGFSTVGIGNIVGPYTLLEANCKLGNFCSIVYSCAIGHDAVLEDYVSIMDYCDITGYDYLEENVYLGSSVCIIPNKRICKNSVLGAGAVVTSDITEAGTYVGVPAKLIKQ